MGLIVEDIKESIAVGIDCHVLEFLLSFKGRSLGDTLCLGRQGLHLYPGTSGWDAADQALAAGDPKCRLVDLVTSDGYSETLLHYLGSCTVTAMDASPFEGAEIIHDLNISVPESLYGKFDFILDGGTIEHVFNFPCAIANVQRMLRPGGIYIGINAANNQLGHGLYQFSPELFWEVFSERQGFKVERMVLVPCTPGASPIELTRTAGVRQEIGLTHHVTYLMVAARRVKVVPIDLTNVFQSDYEARWNL